MTVSPPPSDTDRLAEAAKQAANDMPFDWYCPSCAGWRRRDCPECVAAVVVAALAPVVSQIAARHAAHELEMAAVLTVPSQDTAEEVREALFRRAEALHAAAALVAAHPDHTDTGDPR